MEIGTVRDGIMRVPHEIHKSFVHRYFGKEALCFRCKCINVWIFDLPSDRLTD